MNINVKAGLITLGIILAFGLIILLSIITKGWFMAVVFVSFVIGIIFWSVKAGLEDW